MRRPLVALVVALIVIGGFTGGLAWLLSDPRPPTGAPQGQRLYYAFCAECHGVDGRGSWRAALFLLRPGDLTDSAMRAHTDQYVFDIIKHGGAPIGRPGMPAFGAQLSDTDIEAVVRYVRTLTSASRSTAP
jgi:mono/diheme cytochrome c family protein